MYFNHPYPAFHVVLMLLVATLSACGFHLRGMQKTEQIAYPIYFAPTGDIRFDTLIQRVYSSYTGGTAPATRAAAQVLISRISEEQHTAPRVVNIDGQEKGLDLQYRFSYEATNAAGTVLQSRTIQLSRTMRYTDNALLAKQSEEEALYKEMRGDAITQMLTQLSKLSLAPTPPNDAPN